MARILVLGKYVDESTYVLTREDGTVFQKIKEGEGFKIANQLREWIPVRVPKKKGKGTILMCRKYGKHNRIIEEFPLIHNKKGLWATSSGSARNGVFHPYREPKTPFEQQVVELGISLKKIRRVDAIDVVLEEGGFLGGARGWLVKGSGIRTDGNKTDVTEFEPWSEDDTRRDIRVTEATYVVEFSIGTHINNCRYAVVDQIILTPEADEELVVAKLQELRDFR